MNKGVTALLCAFGFTVAFATEAAATEQVIVTNNTWKVIAPLGDNAGAPMNTVGLPGIANWWETQNVGWNTSLSFNDAGWSNAIVHPTEGPPYIWADTSATPAYFRHEFFLSGAPTEAILTGGVDDDAFIYINGTLVYGSADGGANSFGPFDVTSYLVAGNNLIAVKAHDSAGSVESFRMRLDIQGGAVPEPATWAMMIGGFGAAGAALRRRKLALT